MSIKWQLEFRLLRAAAVQVFRLGFGGRGGRGSRNNGMVPFQVRMSRRVWGSRVITRSTSSP